MNITKISEGFSTSPQISADQISNLATLGFKTIVNFRPDREGGAEQPTSEELKETCKAYGIEYVYIPIVPNMINADQINQFKSVLANHAGPILGFCRTGNRALTIFQHANSAQQAPSQVNGLLAWLKSKCLITKLIRKLRQK